MNTIRTKRALKTAKKNTALFRNSFKPSAVLACKNVRGNQLMIFGEKATKKPGYLLVSYLEYGFMETEGFLTSLIYNRMGS